jgi:hypothetical protein
MVCLRNICVNTLHKGDSDDDNNIIVVVLIYMYCNCSVGYPGTSNSFLDVIQTETIRSYVPVTLVNIQNVSVTKIVDFSSIQCSESKYGLRSQFLALVAMIHEVWFKA